MQEKLHFATDKKIRLDEFLREELPHCKQLKGHEVSNSKIRRLVVAGAVSVNGREVVRPAFELRGKSDVCVALDIEKFFFEKQPDDAKFEVSEASVLYEDDDLIFIDKPARFPVEQTITGNRANLHDSLVDFLWHRNPALRNPPYAGIMHRLDRETSGVILFTKTRSVNAAVSDLFQKHDLTKQYLAVVEVPRHTDGIRHAELVSASISTFTVKMFIGRVTGKSQQGKWGELSEARGGQFSHTDFKVLRTLTVEGRSCLLLECTLHTGRTHQIRVHLASRGLPILGDTLYGGHPATRMYLHAAHLAFKLGDKEYDVQSTPDFLAFS